MKEKAQKYWNIERFIGFKDVRSNSMQKLRTEQGTEHTSRDIQFYLKVKE